MNSTINDSMDDVKDMMTSAKHGTEHAVASTRSVLLEGIRTVGSVVSILRGFGIGDALGWFGLARRNRMSSFGTFGAGVALGAGLGAGLGMLFAPMSGADTRRAIQNGMKGLLGDAEKTVEKAEASVENAGKQAASKVGDLAAKAKTAVIHAEHQIEQAVTERADAIKEPVRAAGATERADAIKEPARAAGATEPGNHHPAHNAH
jgi:gas vesicle protein